LIYTAKAIRYAFLNVRGSVSIFWVHPVEACANRPGR
jgi:hypothetical protein